MSADPYQRPDLATLPARDGRQIVNAERMEATIELLERDVRLLGAQAGEIASLREEVNRLRAEGVTRERLEVDT